jgi:lactoylglutathione lyase
MKLNHVSLFVSDLQTMENFFETYFKTRATTIYFNPKTKLKSCRLILDDGSKIEIMEKPELLQNDKAINTVGYNHIAIGVGGKEAVNVLTKRLEKDGYKIVSYPHTTGDGCYESYVLDPEGNLIEIDE